MKFPAAVLDVSIHYILHGEQEEQYLDKGWMELGKEALESGVTKEQFKEYLEFNKWKRKQN
ncbi:anti-repressor SinI family protein [Thalassobacillus devorans]|uniref:anti-repressor SinI family protein n=1 Tax=Thalassobacillus devorans TaxID=279813 RepID=UPI0004B7C66C|nr:anti-repressor SinI family protein [Thalassobacillus devorans]